MNTKKVRHNYCNVDYLRLEKSYHGFSIKIKSGKLEDHVYFLQSEYDLIISQIENNKPSIWFGDISYHIQFSKRSITIMNVYKGDDNTHYYSLPTKMISEYIEYLQSYHDDYPIAEYNHHALNVIWYQLDYQDKIGVVDIDDDIKAVYRDMVLSSKTGDKTALEFINGFKSIVSWSLCGMPTRLMIIYDGYQDKQAKYPSLYWNISNLAHERLINGGLIFHRKYDENNTSLENVGEYSIHT